MRRVAESRDREAFARLYDLYAPLLFGLSVRIVGHADAEDALQEAMIQIWERAADFDGAKGSVRAWLVVITRSRCLDRLRQKEAAGRRQTPLPDGEDFIDGSAASGEALEHREAEAAVLEALASLPQEQRQALEAGYFGGLSQSEIAKDLGQPLGTIKTRMRLGMIKLMEQLKPLLEP